MNLMLNFKIIVITLSVFFRMLGRVFGHILVNVEFYFVPLFVLLIFELPKVVHLPVSYDKKYLISEILFD